MCVFSMVGDHYGEKWGHLPYINPQPQPGIHVTPGTVTVFPALATQAELEALRREVLDMKELLKRAIKYDTEHGQPGCENEDKVKLLRRVADLVGVSLEDVLGSKP